MVWCESGVVRLWVDFGIPTKIVQNVDLTPKRSKIEGVQTFAQHRIVRYRSGGFKTPDFALVIGV